MADWSLTDLHDRRNPRRLTPLHKHPWRSVQGVNRSLLDRIDRNRIANWSPMSPAKRKWKSTIAVAALSNPITQTSMKAYFVIKITFDKTYCDYISWSFCSISRFILRFRFSWQKCCTIICYSLEWWVLTISRQFENLFVTYMTTVFVLHITMLWKKEIKIKKSISKFLVVILDPIMLFFSRYA